MVELESAPGRTCVIDGKELLFFSGYSYLGMNKIPEFINLVKEGTDKYGLLFPSSRISNTQLKLYDELENALSELTGSEETVTFSSGFLAGKTISSVLSSYKNILTAPFTHPAIQFNKATEQESESLLHWCNRITDVINSSLENEFVVAFDSVNILTSEIIDPSFLLNINANKKLIVLIDDSHGIGLLGKNGQGVAGSLPKCDNIEFIISFSLAKALNIQGGAISCSSHFADKLRQHPNYTASTAIIPALAFAFLHSKSLYAARREKLLSNISYVRSRTGIGGLLKNDPGLPVFVCIKPDAEEVLFRNNIVISSFRYPYPTSAKINRVVINSLHTPDDIDQLFAML